MFKKCCITLLVICIAVCAPAQVLFTYGDNKVDAKEFLKAYKKNNVRPATNKAKSISDYLDLYINSRLKIHEAYQRGYDTLPQIKNEVNSLRAQIIENYMSDPGTANRLLTEAFQRSQKDIRAGHIFIAVKPGASPADTATAFAIVTDIMTRLKKGEDFSQLARQSSNDPSAKTNGGDLGYITVFTLPYEFENIFYSTPVGKVAPPYRSKSGYHIFKNMGERKAKGVMQAQQILLAIPPGSDEATKKAVALRADSLYRRIMAGDNFDKLATSFSNDYVSAASAGKMPDIIVGQYDPVFETALWSLTKNGAVSKPFLTSHGYHIVKRIGVKPVVTDPGNKENMKNLEQKVTVDARSVTSRDFIYQRVRNKPGLKKSSYMDAVLWALSDSLLDNLPMETRGNMNEETLLFSIGDTSFKVTNWLGFARSYRYKKDGTGKKSYEELMREFENASMYNYYRDHLEEYNDVFRTQMAEFTDGNLFFEVMQQDIWNRGQTDSLALVSLYEKNKQKYLWKPSADVVIFFCSDAVIATTVYDQVKKDPSNWKKTIAAVSEKVMADSARHEWDQIPGLNKKIPQPGLVTAPIVNTADNTAAFSYIIKVYNKPMQRSFIEAKGLVINDYQAKLEAEWIKELRKKYPVIIDQKVLNTISK